MIRKILAFTLLVIIVASCKKVETTDYSAIDKKIIENYLTTNNLTAQSTASGLYYIIEKPGGVNHPNINSYVSVNYNGTLINGTLFDTSYSTGKPYTSSLSGKVAGWMEGLQLIGVGGKIKLFLPSALAYGSSEVVTTYTTIPANSVLIFEIELVEFY